MSTASEIVELFESKGREWYGGEQVSQLEHALQAAMFAEQQGAGNELIVAALLHDVGHLLHDLPEDVADQGIDDCHEVRARPWLAERFGPAVTEPVTMHVAAKRYLCAVEEGYLANLSDASRQTLEIQGGVMNHEERRAFEERAFYQEAVSLRKWDDAAKVVGMETPELDHYLQIVEQLIESGQE